MIKAPFNELQNVTKLISLRKRGHTIEDLAFYFLTSKERVSKTLSIHHVGSKGIPRTHTRKLTGTYKDSEVTEDFVVLNSRNKYDRVFEEPINKGHNYRDIVKKQGVKIPKNFFGRMT